MITARLQTVVQRCSHKAFFTIILGLFLLPVTSVFGQQATIEVIVDARELPRKLLRATLKLKAPEIISGSTDPRPALPRTLASPHACVSDRVRPMSGVALMLGLRRPRDYLGAATLAVLWASPTLGHFGREFGIDQAFALLTPPILSAALLLPPSLHHQGHEFRLASLAPCRSANVCEPPQELRPREVPGQIPPGLFAIGHVET